MSSKEWTAPYSNSANHSNPEEWSVHAQLTFTQQSGNIVLRTSDTGSVPCSCQPRGDSGYSSERIGSPRCHDASNVGARATCRVTVGDHHTVTLTCSELLEPHQCFKPNYPPVKDAICQTSASLVPQVIHEQIKKRRLKKSPRRSPASRTSSSDSKKTPRTVHIDVYCTGSDSESSSDESNSTPQTVFESNKLRITHSKANSDQLPHAIQKQKRRVLSNSYPTSFSDLSTSYPSSIVSNFDNYSLLSESTYSSMISDLKTDEIKSCSLTNDSFDYENSFDKLRIEEKEKIWKASKKPCDSSSSSDESEGLAWSFGQIVEKQGVKREDTVRRADTRELTNIKKSGSISDSETSLYKKHTKISNPVHKFEHWSKAQKFGTIIGTLKRPGHHVGPSKNPDCSCDTCKYFFEHICFRNRTKSLSGNQ